MKCLLFDGEFDTICPGESTGERHAVQDTCRKKTLKSRSRDYIVGGDNYLVLGVFRVRNCNFSQLFIEYKSAWRLVRSFFEESG